MALALGAKLSLVVVKQISKPIATFVKREAKAHPMLAIPLEYAGSTTHRLGINLQRVILGKGMLSRGSIATVAPLTREHAVDLGAELLGETVIFSIAGGTVAIEMVRQVRRAARDASLEPRSWRSQFVVRAGVPALPWLAEPRQTSRRAESSRERTPAVGGARAPARARPSRAAPGRSTRRGTASEPREHARARNLGRRFVRRRSSAMRCGET